MNKVQGELRTLYPPIEPYANGKMDVGDGHRMYYEECGTPKGKPVLFVHGGPGGSIQSVYRQFFDPNHYRIILFDQRGCGMSTPYASLENNTTWHLVADMEKLREKLKIEKWQIFGGSWGSTLSLAYAETHPDRVTEIILRGIFLLREKEINWFYQEGASVIYPDAWEDYLRPIPPEEHDNLLAAYFKRLTSDDASVKLTAAKAWSTWEAATSKLFPDAEMITQFGSDNFAVAFARIECHYFVNKGFFEKDSQLLENVTTIRNIPGVIVQGRYDVVCPMVSAWDLHRAWPEADLRIVQDAGHSVTETGITHELVTATERFKL